MDVGTGLILQSSIFSDLFVKKTKNSEVYVNTAKFPHIFVIWLNASEIAIKH